MSERISDLQTRFVLNFIKDDRYKFMLEGFGATIKITFFAILLGLFLGVITAVIRATYDTTHTTKYGSLGQRILQYLLSFLNLLAKLYLTVIRGTPTLLQLLIIYFVIFGSVNVNKIFVAVLAFGINSGAYVTEIVRSGIMSVDKGQFEAGRSLGFGYIPTMVYIILPQAVKNILPAIGNEFIVLLKETSVSGYIAIQDLTKGADIIRSQTYDAFMPLIGAALVYLVCVVILSHFVTLLERRLRSNEQK